MMHPLYKFDSTLAFLWLVSLILLSSASSLDTVCGSIKKLGSCKAVINVPTLAIKTCKEEFFKVMDLFQDTEVAVFNNLLGGSM